MGRDRREHVAAVEGRRDRLEPERREGDVGSLDGAAEALDRRPQEAVVRADENPLVLGHPHRHRASARTDPGINDRQVDPGRGERERRDEHQRAGTDVVALDPVGEVDEPGLGRDPGDHRPADSGELIPVAVVAQERDRKRHGAVVLAPVQAALTGAGRPSR